MYVCNILTMRKLIIPLVLLGASVVSCNKLADIIVIRKNVEYTQDQDIPNIPNPGVAFPTAGVTIPFPKYSLVTNSSTFFKDNNTSSNLLTSVKPHELGITLIQPANTNLDYVDTMRVYISADGLPEVLAAHEYGKNNASAFNLTPEDVELKSYFLKDSMYVRLEAHFIDYPDSNSKIQVKTSLAVVANPLK